MGSENMIVLKGMISIQLLKKEAFCGSDEKMRYRLYKEETGGEAKLAAAYWFTPYCWQATSPEEKTVQYFEFTTDGIWKAVEWLNAISEERKRDEQEENSDN